MTIYYMALTGNGGSDSNDGLTTGTPWATFNFAVPQLVAGDTLFVRQGTYAQGIDTNTQAIASGTSWANAITCAGYPGETVTLTGGIGFSSGVNVSYLIFDNFILTGIPAGQIYVGVGSHHLRFTNIELVGDRNLYLDWSNLYYETHTALFAGGANFVEMINCKLHDGFYAFYVTGQNCLYDRLQVYNNLSYGIHMFNSGQNNVNDNTVSNCIAYGNGYFDPRGFSGPGIIVASGNNNLVYNNIVYDNKLGIIVAYTNGGTNNRVYNNTVYSNDGFGIQVFDSAPGTAVKNNISYENIGNIQDWGAVGSDITDNLEIDPFFVNPAIHDYRLQAGSPAINMGTTLAAVPVDFLGVARPQGAAYDIGAYEFVGGGGPPGPQAGMLLGNRLIL